MDAAQEHEDGMEVVEGDNAIPEFGGASAEILSLLADVHPSGKSKGKKALKRKKDSEEQISPQSVAMLNLFNRLLTREVLEMEEKLKNGGKKKRKTTDKPPTPKQLAQRAAFVGKVGVARKYYYAAGKKGVDHWQVAMKKAYSSGTSSEPSNGVQQ